MTTTLHTDRLRSSRMTLDHAFVFFAKSEQFLTPTSASRFPSSTASSGVAANPNDISFSRIALPEHPTLVARPVGQNICRTRQEDNTRENDSRDQRRSVGGEGYFYREEGGISARNQGEKWESVPSRAENLKVADMLPVLMRTFRRDCCLFVGSKKTRVCLQVFLDRQLL